MQVNDRLKLLLVIGVAGLLIGVLAGGVMLLMRPALAAIDLQPVLIGVEDMQAGLYGTAFHPGPAELSEAYPNTTELPKAVNGATLAFTAPEGGSGTVWIWLYRELQIGDQLYGIMRADSLNAGAEDSEYITNEGGELEQIGERAVYHSFDTDFPPVDFRMQLHNITLQRCAAVVRVRMKDTDFATVLAYAQRLDVRLQREVCGWWR